MLFPEFYSDKKPDCFLMKIKLILILLLTEENKQTNKHAVY